MPGLKGSGTLEPQMRKSIDFCVFVYIAVGTFGEGWRVGQIDKFFVVKKQRNKETNTNTQADTSKHRNKPMYQQTHNNTQTHNNALNTAEALSLSTTH